MTPPSLPNRSQRPPQGARTKMLPPGVCPAPVRPPRSRRPRRRPQWRRVARAQWQSNRSPGGPHRRARQQRRRSHPVGPPSECHQCHKRRQHYPVPRARRQSRLSSTSDRAAPWQKKACPRALGLPVGGAAAAPLLHPFILEAAMPTATPRGVSGSWLLGKGPQGACSANDLRYRSNSCIR